MENKTYTQAEVEALLKANGIEIKTFAQTAKQFKNGTLPEEIQKTVVEKATWKLLICNYPDFVIERKTVKTTTQAAFMISQNTCYIKDVNKNTVKEIDEDSWVKFSAGMPDIELPDNFWIKTIKGGKVFISGFLNALKNQTYLEMIKFRCVKKFEALYCGHARYNLGEIYDESLKAYRAYPIIYREFYNDPEISHIVCESAIPLILDMIDAFGLNNTRDFLKSFKNSLVTTKNISTHRYSTLSISCYEQNPFKTGITHNWNLESQSGNPNIDLTCRCRITMDYKSFKEYVLYTSVRMGFAMSMTRFWVIWADTLYMQYYMYGKIKEKYPDNLQIMHDQLSYMCALKKTEIDQKKFNEQFIKASKYEMTIRDYVFIAPKTPEDFYDEATQQANCLASYVDKYTNGNDMIFFMRDKSTPEKSLVTIELVGESVIQKFQAHNHPCTTEQNQIIEKWVEKIKEINKKEVK